MSRELLQAVQLGTEDRRELLRRNGVVEHSPGNRRHFGKQVFVVAIAEAEAGGADGALLQPVRDDLADLSRLDDADVQMTIAEQQHAAGVAGGSFEQLIATKHPASSQVGAAAGLNLAHGLKERLLIRGGLQRNQRARCIREHHDAEQVARAQIANGDLRGLLRTLNGFAVHGAAAVQHQTEGSRRGAGRGLSGGLQAEREVDRRGLVGEDGLVIEVRGYLHSLVFLDRLI